MSDNGIARVHYFERQFLRTQDFVDEQSYHLAMRRRHNIAQHTWGIVHGLEVVAEEGNLFVQPGMAIDGYGRELILQQRQALATAAFVEKNSDVLDVWLLYDRLASDQAPQGYAGCGNGVDAAFYRWQEQPQLRLDLPDPAFPNRRQPESVPIGDLTFPPARTPPDDPVQDWPVFLGQVRRDQTNPTQPFIVDLTDRPYVGLVGESIVAPWDHRVQLLQVGGEHAADLRRFVVFVPDANTGQPQARLQINQAGETTIHGKTTLQGNLRLAGKAIEFGVGVASSQRPWQIYRHLEKRQETSQDQTTPQEIVEQQLRIEMAPVPAGGTPGRNQVVVGAWSVEEKKFKPCLTIADDCTVTVHGNLVVEGSLHEVQKRAAAALSQEARQFLLAGAFSGLNSAAVLFEPVQRITPVIDPTAVIRSALSLEPTALLPAVAELLAAHPEQQAAFVALLRDQYSTVAENLRAALAPEDDTSAGNDSQEREG
jgi:hypothetical protein